MDFAETIRGIFGGQSSQAPPTGEDYASDLKPMVEPTGSRRPKLSLSIPKPTEHDPVLGEELHKILADSASEAAALRTRESVRPTGGREEGGATTLIEKLPGALISAPFRGIAQGAEDMRRVFGGQLDPMSPEGIGEGMNAAMQVMGQSPFAARGSLGAGGGRLVQPGYHGSPRTDLDVIKASPESRQFDNATSQFGAFFAPTEGAAKRYAGDTGRVYKTDLDLKNPYEMPWSEFNAYQSPHKGANGESLFEGGENALKARAEELKVQAAQHRRELEGLGHDGIVVRNSRGEPIEIASFNDVKTGGVEDMIKAYHGSPHDFDRFDLSKIGTGEGAQAYGHGLYFAENEGVAKGYREALSKNQEGWVNTAKRLVREHTGAEIDDDAARSFLNATSQHKDDPVRAAKVAGWGSSALRGLDAEKLKDAAVALKGVQPGRMYEVGIRANPEHFLDWDKPLSEQHPKVQEAIEKVHPNAINSEAQRMRETLASLQAKYPTSDPMGQQAAIQRGLAKLEGGGGMRGQDLLQKLFMRPGGTEQGVSQALREAGIPGIKYLDQGSRTPKTLLEGRPIPQDHTAAQLAAEKLDIHGSPDAAMASLRRDATQGHPYIRQDSQKAHDLLQSGAVKRHQPEGTRNFVVFDDKLIDILKKYGIAGIGALPAMNAFHYQDKQ